MKNSRSQTKKGKERLNHYIIRSENYLCWLFVFFAVCSIGLLIYSVMIQEALWAILFLLFISIVMVIAAFNIGLWKVEVNDMEIIISVYVWSRTKVSFWSYHKGSV